MALNGIDPNPSFVDYAVRWGEAHKWNLREGDARTRNADNQCCGQTYLDLYAMDPKPERIAAIKQSIDGMVASEKVDDWNWVDAIQMAMPVFIKFGAMTKDPKYFDKAHQIYLHTRNVEGGKGLFNPADGLWWRDKDFVPPYKEPNGKSCYWARGNGWVIAALVRTLDLLPADSPYRAEYTTMFKTMCTALLKVQRTDGDRSIIAQGVAKGEQVVTRGQLRLGPKVKVQIAKSAEAS
jgi:rhamnogalacturonyl hydrolase YesR